MDFSDIGSVASIASGIPGIGIAGPILGGLGALGGLLGAASARKRQEQARQRALMELSGRLDTEYNNLVAGHARTMAETAGYGGDAIRALGANLGAANAAGGVTNSSAVAGSNALAAQGEQRSLTDLAARNRQSELDMLGGNQRYLAGLNFNLAGENFNNAALRENQAGSGLMSFLGSLGQTNLLNMGVNKGNNTGPLVKNGMNNGDTASVIDSLSNYNKPKKIPSGYGNMLPSMG